MQVENILTLLGVLCVAVSYVVLLIGVAVIDSESGKSLYLLGGVIGLLVGIALVGFAKMIRAQTQLNKQADDLIKLTRMQLRHLDEIRKALVGEMPTTATPTAKPAKVIAPNAKTPAKAVEKPPKKSETSL